jgi:hypothetical protein
LLVQLTLKTLEVMLKLKYFEIILFLHGFQAATEVVLLLLEFLKEKKRKRV